MVVGSGRRFLLSTTTAEPRSGGGAQQPQSGPVKREFIFLIYFLFIGGGGEQHQSDGGGMGVLGGGGGAHRPPFLFCPPPPPVPGRVPVVVKNGEGDFCCFMCYCYTNLYLVVVVALFGAVFDVHYHSAQAEQLCVVPLGYMHQATVPSECAWHGPVLSCLTRAALGPGNDARPAGLRLGEQGRPPQPPHWPQPWPSTPISVPYQDGAVLVLLESPPVS